MKRFLGLIFCIQYLQLTSSAGVATDDENSGITFVQIKPLINRSFQNDRPLTDSFRTSRIENLPLQIKSVQQHHPHPTTGKALTDQKVFVTDTIRTPRSHEKYVVLPEHSTETTDSSTDYADRENESEDRFDTSDVIAQESEQLPQIYNDRISTTQTENDLYKQQRFYAKAPPVVQKIHIPTSEFGKPRIFSAKKYYGTNFDAGEPSYRKYVEMRRYRSRCRCEKIWNCPKMQISVPRCPNEEFYCCF